MATHHGQYKRRSQVRSSCTSSRSTGAHILIITMPSSNRPRSRSRSPERSSYRPRDRSRSRSRERTRDRSNERKRSRSRSPEEDPIHLPHSAKPISQKDYFQKSDEFRVWLKKEKGKVRSSESSVQPYVLSAVLTSSSSCISFSTSMNSQGTEQEGKPSLRFFINSSDPSDG